MTEGIGWIVDADVSGYFDSIDRTRLREVLRKRVNDGSILRLIGKWLRAGVMEGGLYTTRDRRRSRRRHLTGVGKCLPASCPGCLV